MKKLLVLVLLLVGCGFAGDRSYNWIQYQVHTPVSSQSKPVNFHIDPGEPTDQIGRDLKTAGLIRDERVFSLYLRYKGGSVHLEAGDFALNKNMDMDRIIATLQHAETAQVAVRMQEGYTMKLMADQAAKAGIGTAPEYLAAAQDPSWQYDFLAGRPPTAPKNLEGFLFPDSYQLDRGATARDLVKRQLDRFAEVVTPDLRAQAAQATAARPAESLWNILILASITEREVGGDADRAIVCDVYYNRLKSGMRIDADATVLYALGEWKASLTLDDLQVNSPYNTRKVGGLPPGPISNPSLAAIKACINPQKTDYFFYFTDPKGVTHYARTSAEFQRQQQQFGVANQ